jgi:hypothetical protein
MERSHLIGGIARRFPLSKLNFIVVSPGTAAYIRAKLHKVTLKAPE